MKVRLVKVTKPNPIYDKLTKDYAKRLSSYGQFESVILKNEKEKKNYLQKAKDDPSHLLVILDERGRQGDSKDFASFILQSLENRQIKLLSFLIGGPYGISQDERQMADSLWRLSPMVLAGDVAWLVLWEQVYRAYAINAGSPYHHE